MIVVVVVVSGRKYGYVKYACADSALAAQTALHRQTICGNRIKVILADPPKYEGSRGGGGSTRVREEDEGGDHDGEVEEPESKQRRFS